MSRRHKEKEISENYKPQQAESQADDSPQNLRWSISSQSSFLIELFSAVLQPKDLDRFDMGKMASAIQEAFFNALVDRNIKVDDKNVMIPRSYFEEKLYSLDFSEKVEEKAKHGRGRKFLSRLINTVEDSKIVKYVKNTYKAAKKKCSDLIENTTQFCVCCLKGLFRSFAPNDDPYGKLSHYHSLLEHEFPDLQSRKTLSNYYNWFVNWKAPLSSYISPSEKKEKYRHSIWERLIAWICVHLLKIAPQYAVV